MDERDGAMSSSRENTLQGVVAMIGLYPSCPLQSRIKTYVLSFEYHSQNVPLPTVKLLHGAIFQPAIPETWQNVFTLLSVRTRLVNFWFLLY